MAYVYFIQQGSSDGPVKIGLAKNPLARLKNLQTASPFQLETLFSIYVGNGAAYVEAGLHRHFRDLNTIGGEWFYWSPDIALLIDGLRKFDARLPRTRDRWVDMVPQGKNRLWCYEHTSKQEWLFLRPFSSAQLPVAVEEHW